MLGKLLIAVPLGIWFLGKKVVKSSAKKRSKDNGRTLENLERLYYLKQKGAVTEDDFNEMKEKLKMQI